MSSSHQSLRVQSRSEEYQISQLLSSKAYLEFFLMYKKEANWVVVWILPDLRWLYMTNHTLKMFSLKSSKTAHPNKAKRNWTLSLTLFKYNQTREDKTRNLFYDHRVNTRYVKIKGRIWKTSMGRYNLVIMRKWTDICCSRGPYWKGEDQHSNKYKKVRRSYKDWWKSMMIPRTKLERLRLRSRITETVAIHIKTVPRPHRWALKNQLLSREVLGEAKFIRIFSKWAFWSRITLSSV